jgi:hypothetical protein
MLVMKHLFDHQREVPNPNDQLFQLPQLSRHTLVGVDFLDVLEGNRDVVPRYVKLKSRHAGWLQLSRSYNAINLLGQSCGQLIRRIDHGGSAYHFWRTVPIGQGYLVATVAHLRQLQNEANRHVPASKGVYAQKKASKLF